MNPTQAQTPSAVGNALTIRPATVADSDALRRLAQLDSAPILVGEVLLAESGNEAVAAIGLGGGSVVANPFLPTAEIRSMLQMRRRELVSPGAVVPWWRRRARAAATEGPSLAGTEA